MQGPKGVGHMTGSPSCAGPTVDAVVLSVVDALVFQRVSPILWAHLGGIGRGAGWAGLVEVASTTEPLLAEMLARPGRVLRRDGESHRVLGPYWATSSACLQIEDDVLVVLGNPVGPLTGSDEQLQAVARRIAGDLEQTTPTKRLADELEVLHAVQAVTGSDIPEDRENAMRHVGQVALASLSCEVGVLRDGTGCTVVVGSAPRLDPWSAELDEVLDHIISTTDDGLLCLQDVADHVWLGPLGAAGGVRSLLALTLPEPVGGVLVVAHTDAAPRGFTTLCRQLGRRVADAGAIVTRTAALCEQLQLSLDEHALLARHDPLTGLGNRLAWEEALTQAQERVDAGLPVTVVMLDLDELKLVNDRYGHAAGDDLIRHSGRQVLSVVQGGDVVCRIGGDEFGLLLQGTASAVQSQLGDLIEGFSAAAGTGVRASVGSATVPARGSINDALVLADASMYAHKRGEPRSGGRPPAQGDHRRRPVCGPDLRRPAPLPVDPCRSIPDG